MGEEITQPEAGQVYRLEIPENDVLLDWNAPLSKQPKKVKAAIRKIAKGIRGKPFITGCPVSKSLG